MKKINKGKQNASCNNSIVKNKIEFGFNKNIAGVKGISKDVNVNKKINKNNKVLDNKNVKIVNKKK